MMDLQNTTDLPNTTPQLPKMSALNVKAAPKEFYYHIPWRTRSVQTGSHKTNLHGSGSDFSAFVPLLAYPDPKRVDVHASLKSIPKQLMVRTFFERNAIKVFAVNDVSASMRFVGKVNKLQLQTDIVAAIAWSAVRQGDAFGMVACDNVIQEAATMQPTHRNMAALEAAKKLSDFFSSTVNSSHSANALPLAVKQMSLQKSLVFLISDFHLPDALIQQTFQALSMHDVVPIVLWDEAEFEALPAWGWAKVVEMETGLRRSLFMRPALHQRIQAYANTRKKALIQLSQQYGMRPPFFVKNQFDATALSHHLMGA